MACLSFIGIFEDAFKKKQFYSFLEMAPQINAFKENLDKSEVESSLYMNKGMRKPLGHE